MKMQLAQGLPAPGASTEEVVSVRWNPSVDTMVAGFSYLLVVAGMLLAFQVFTLQQMALNFITFGPLTLAGLGVAVPVLYMVVVRHRPLSDLGLTRRHLLPSLVLGLLLGIDTFRNTLATLNIEWASAAAAILPVATMTLAVGLFESIFFRGWLQLRFEAAFGLVPGLILAALCYSLYHVGYGMTLEEMTFLFGYGLVFGGLFRLTKNIALLWPFYTPVGGLYEQLRSGLTMPFEATYGFVITLGLMIAVVVFAAVWYKRHNSMTQSPRLHFGNPTPVVPL